MQTTEQVLEGVLKAAQDHSGRVPEAVYNEARQFLDTMSKNAKGPAEQVEFVVPDGVKISLDDIGRGEVVGLQGPIEIEDLSQCELPKKRAAPKK